VVVKPIFATPGHLVWVTGTIIGQKTGFYTNVCKTATVTVTVMYYSTSGGVKTTSTVVGSASAIAGMTKPVLIPADAQPTRISHQYAEVQASCRAGTGASPTTYISEPDAVTVSGGQLTRASATAATTTTAAPTTTTTPHAVAVASTTTTAAGTATSTTSSATSLAQTGSNIALMAVVGGLLVVMGGFLLFSDDRKRHLVLQRVRRR
jgi:LPXTG-motif cell wall-anchored protein